MTGCEFIITYLFAEPWGAYRGGSCKSYSDGLILIVWEYFKTTDFSTSK